jgi:hypothetical protein
MEYQQALIMGRRGRSDAALALSMYMQERATDICAVKPAKGQGMDAKEWEPVGEQSFKEICIRTTRRRFGPRLKLGARPIQRMFGPGIVLGIRPTRRTPGPMPALTI